MTKFVGSITDVVAGVDILVEDFNGTMKLKGGLVPAIEHYVLEAMTDNKEYNEIFVVDGNLEMANNIAAVLNAKYEEEMGKMKQHNISQVAVQEEVVGSMKPTFVFNGKQSEVAFGNEVVAMENTQEAALSNIVNNMKKGQETQNQTKETKGAGVEMNIKELVGRGVSDLDALKMAEEFRKANSAKMKDAQVAVGNVKGQVAGVKTGGVETPVPAVPVSSAPVFGGSVNVTQNKTQETKGGNEMKNTVKDAVKGAGQEVKGNTAPKSGGQQTNGLQRFNPSFVFNAPTAAATTVESRSGYDETAREGGRTGFPGAWYCNAEEYKSLKDFAMYYTNRRALPTNALGLTAINFLDPKNKKNVPYDNNYDIIVEMVFGMGANVRFKLSRFTAEQKAEMEARGLRVSKSDWKTGNIEWMSDNNGGLAPRYAFATPNDFVMAVKCECGKTVNARAKREVKCQCGKKHNAIHITPTMESAAGVNFVEDRFQPQWNKVVLDNFNITIHKDVLALALACAAYERFLPMYGLMEEDGEVESK